MVTAKRQQTTTVSNYTESAYCTLYHEIIPNAFRESVYLHKCKAFFPVGVEWLQSMEIQWVILSENGQKMTKRTEMTLHGE